MKQSLVLRLAVALLAMGACFGMKAQTVSGVVLDAATSEPLPGATVTIKGSTAATSTDIDGKFTIKTERESGSIHVVYIGYMPATVGFKSGETLTVSLREDTQMLDEVVAIGYGVQRKSDLTGSVSSVNPDGLKSLPATNVIAAMQGKVSGVEIDRIQAPPALPIPYVSEAWVRSTTATRSMLSTGS